MLDYVRTYLVRLLPQASSRLTANILNVIKDRQIVGLLGFLGLIWTAMNLFGSIRTVLNKTLEIVSHHGYLREKIPLSALRVDYRDFVSTVYCLKRDFRSDPDDPGQAGVAPLVGLEVVGLVGRNCGRLFFFGLDVFYPVPFFAHTKTLHSGRPTFGSAHCRSVGGGRIPFSYPCKFFNFFAAVYGPLGCWWSLLSGSIIPACFLSWAGRSCGSSPESGHDRGGGGKREEGKEDRR